MSEVYDSIARLVEESCIALFSDYRIAIARSEERAQSEVAFCGVIGFTGPDMRGSLMLACSREPLVLAQISGDAMMRDWLAELTNQLLGRVKNRLLAFGTVIHSALPVVLAGERIAPISTQPLGHLFTADGGVVSVWFDTELRDDFVLAPVDNPAPIGREGETILF
ncbi:MAG TPA: chemotaxis protein CheX [Kofleriaceae bacterium]